MRNVIQFVVATLFLVSCTHAACAQGQSNDSADTSAAQAAIQAIQGSAQPSAKSQQAFPALKTEACKVAVPYVESQSGPLGDWDRAMTKYKIDRDDGMASIQRVKSDLLSDTWWARSSGADVASDVSTFCNLLLHIAGAMSPTGETVSFARDVSSEFSLKVKEQSVKVFQAIDTGGNVMDAIQGGTEELAIQASQQSLRRIGAGQFSAIIDVLKDVQKHAEQAQKATQFKGTVQEQLRKLDDMLAKYSKDMNLQRERLEAIEGIKDTVVAACNS